MGNPRNKYFQLKKTKAAFHCGFHDTASIQPTRSLRFELSFRLPNLFQYWAAGRRSASQ